MGKSEFAYASRRSDVVACESEDDPTTAYASRRSDIARESGDDGWTKVGKAKVTRIALHTNVSDEILQLLQGVAMVKSARRAITGDGI